jgi:PAP2 superfamily
MAETRPEKDRAASGSLADCSPMGASTANFHDGKEIGPSGRPEQVAQAGGSHRAMSRGPAGLSLRAIPSRVRTSMRFPGRPRLWIEILVVGAAYWLYSLVRNAVPNERAVALRHAGEIWNAEHAVGLPVERWINHSANSVSWLIVGMNYYYATLHFVVTLAVLIWLFRRHPGRYAASRTVLGATTGMALVGFYFFPLAPPRLMNAGFIDTTVVHHTWGSFSHGGLASVSNQFAAMPSMHIGWSTWCAIMLVAFAERRWVKILGLLYPLATLVVIISTGNHFWLDAAGGLVCLAVGFGIAYLVHGRLPHQFPRLPIRRPAKVTTAPGAAGGSSLPAPSR